MFTTASKFFFAIAAISLVPMGADRVLRAFLGQAVFHFGYNQVMVLVGVGTVSFVLGVVVMSFRDGTIPATGSLAGAGASVIASAPRPPAPATGSSMWPLVGAFGVVVAAVGLVVDTRICWFGLVILLATLGEWMVQAWADRASADPAYNTGIRNRLMHPIEFPLFGAVIVGVVVFAFSRVMLALNENAAIVVFAMIGVVVVAGAVLLTTRPHFSKNAMAALALAGGAVLLAGAISGVASGEQKVTAETENVRNASNAVANKSATIATVVRTADGSLRIFVDGRPTGLLTVPRSLFADLLFRNDAPGAAKLETVVQKSVTLADGTSALEPETLETVTIDTGKTQLLTVRYPKPGQYEITAVAVDGSEQKAAVLVP